MCILPHLGASSEKQQQYTSYLTINESKLIVQTLWSKYFDGGLLIIPGDVSNGGEMCFGLNNRQQGHRQTYYS